MSRAHSLPSGAITIGGHQLTRRALVFLAVAALLVVFTIVVAHYSVGLFAVVGALLLASLGYAGWHWPQVTLIVLAIIPIFDRYVVSLMIPDELHLIARVFSEALLVVLAAVIGARALYERRVNLALRQPMTIAFGAFLVLAAASTVLNDVPIANATLGVLFTVDAMILFFLAAMIPWRRSHLAALSAILVSIAGVAAVLAIAQVVLASDILGLSASAGRFGEGARIGSFFGGNPNMLGAMLVIGAPYCFFGALHLQGRAWRLASAGLGFILVLALLFTFSRGAWFGLAGAVLVAGLLYDRRVLAVAALTAALAFSVGEVLPRELLKSTPGDPPPQTDFLGSTFDRFNTIGAGNDLRVRFVDQGLGLLEERPLLGVGPGLYGGAVAHSWGSPVHDSLGAAAPQRMVDNFWLHLLVEFGILGTVAYIAIYVAAAFRPMVAAWRSSGLRLVLLAGALSAMAALALDSVTEMILEGNTFSIPAWLLLGIAAAVPWHVTPQSPVTAPRDD